MEIVFPFTRLAGRFIIQPFDVVVPVPAEDEERAGRVVRELEGKDSGYFLRGESLPKK